MTPHPLASFREQHGLTQDGLAALVKSTRWTINRIENGARRPSGDLMIRLCRETGLKFEDFILWQRKDAA